LSTIGQNLELHGKVRKPANFDKRAAGEGVKGVDRMVARAQPLSHAAPHFSGGLATVREQQDFAGLCAAVAH
jgi:hypothetical protein